MFMGIVGVTKKVYDVIAELTVEAGVTRTDLMYGTPVILIVTPLCSESMILPSRV